MDINRFTEKSREALTTAQGLAAQYGHQEVDAEHLALALVNQEDGFSLPPTVLIIKNKNDKR